MKRVLVTLLLFIGTYSLMNAQSVFRTVTAKGLPSADEISTNQVSLNNAWFGSSMSYQLTGDQNFDQNFLFNANIIYNLDLGIEGWNFPVVGNIQMPLTSSNFEDIRVSVNPWSIVSKPDAPTIVVVHGSVGYSIDPEFTSDASPQAFRMLAGGEVSVPIGTNDLPITLSVTPGWEWFNLDRGNNLFLETTFILPIAPNLGVIGEYKWSNNDLPNDSRFSAGVIINGAIGG